MPQPSVTPAGVNTFHFTIGRIQGDLTVVDEDTIVINEAEVLRPHGDPIELIADDLVVSGPAVAHILDHWF
jgi:hypothetical protein